MGKSKLTILLLVFLVNFASAQVNRYIVFLTDKNGTPYSINNPSQFLSEKAIERRTLQGISIDEFDLPVNPSYIQQLKDAGASVFYSTKWMNAVLVSCDASLVPSLLSLGVVQSVELVAPGEINLGGRSKSTKSRKNGLEEATTAQLSLIGLDRMQEDGYRGEEIRIAIFDSGFSGVNSTAPFQSLLTDNRIELTYDFVHRNTNVFQFDDHGTRVLSIIGANEPGTYTGGAHQALFQLFLTEDVGSEYRIEEYNWLFAAERADSAGVAIINSSLGYNTFDLESMNYIPAQMNGQTAVVTRAAQLASSKGILVVASAGNEGLDPSWQIITAPADGEDVLAIGNVSASGIRSATSSIGPTADGRIKPDVMAVGVGAAVVRANGTVVNASGTSFSSPMVAALSAGLWQRFPSLTNKELIQVIRNSATMSNNPDNLMGYGIPHYEAAVNFLEELQQEEPLAVFPNPVTGNYLTIRTKSPEELPSVSFQLITSQGQTVQQNSIQFTWLDNEYELDLSSLSVGVYILTLHTQDKRYTYKVIRL